MASIFVDEPDVKSAAEMPENLDAAVGDVSEIPEAAEPLHEGFSIREFVARIRRTDLKKCWPFSERLLNICLQDGRNPPLPPLEVPSFSSRLIKTGTRYQNDAGRCLGEENAEKAHLKHSLRENLQTEKENDRMDEAQKLKERRGRRDSFELSEKVQRGNFTAEDSSKFIKCFRRPPSKESYFKGCEHIEKEAAQNLPEPGESTEQKDAPMSVLSTEGNKNPLRDEQVCIENEISRKMSNETDAFGSETKSLSPELDWKQANYAIRCRTDNCDSDEGSAVKLCPVCRSFTSSTINAVNAHMDSCLTQVSNKDVKQGRRQNSKWKTQKKRSILEIFACAPAVSTDIEMQGSKNQFVNSSVTLASADIKQFASIDSMTRKKRVRKQTSKDLQAKQGDYLPEQLNTKRGQRDLVVTPAAVSSPSWLIKDRNDVGKMQCRQSKGPNNRLPVPGKKANARQRRKRSASRRNLVPFKTKHCDSPPIINASIIANELNSTGLFGRKKTKRNTCLSKTEEPSSNSTISNFEESLQISAKCIHVPSDKTNEPAAKGCMKHIVQSPLGTLGQSLQSNDTSAGEGTNESPRDLASPVVVENVNRSINLRIPCASLNAASLKLDSAKQPDCSDDSSTLIPDLNAAIPDQNTFHSEGIEIPTSFSQEDNLADSRRNSAEATLTQVTKAQDTSFLSKRHSVGLPVDSEGLLVQRITDMEGSFGSAKLSENPEFDFVKKVSPPPMPDAHPQRETKNLSPSCLFQKSTAEYSGNQRVLRLMGKSFVVETQESLLNVQENENVSCREPQMEEDAVVLSEITRTCCVFPNSARDSPQLGSSKTIDLTTGETDFLLPRFERRTPDNLSQMQKSQFPRHIYSNNYFLCKKSSNKGCFPQQPWNSASLSRYRPISELRSSQGGFSRSDRDLQSFHPLAKAKGQQINHFFLKNADHSSADLALVENFPANYGELNSRNHHPVFVQPMNCQFPSSSGQHSEFAKSKAKHSISISDSVQFLPSPNFPELPLCSRGKLAISSEYTYPFALHGMHGRSPSPFTNVSCEEITIVSGHQREKTTAFVDFLSSSERRSDSSSIDERQFTETEEIVRIK